MLFPPYHDRSGDISTTAPNRLGRSSGEKRPGLGVNIHNKIPGKRMKYEMKVSLCNVDPNSLKYSALLFEASCSLLCTFILILSEHEKEVLFPFFNESTLGKVQTI